MSGFDITALKLDTYLNLRKGGWNPFWGYTAFFRGAHGLQEQPTKVMERRHAHKVLVATNFQQEVKNFTRARIRTIDNSVAVRQCTGSSTTSLIRLLQKKKASRKFSNLLLRYHCFETRYLFKPTEGWLEPPLGPVSYT